LEQRASHEGREKKPSSFYHGCPIGFCEGGHGSGCDIIMMGSFDFETTQNVGNIEEKAVYFVICDIKE